MDAPRKPSRVRICDGPREAKRSARICTDLHGSARRRAAPAPTRSRVGPARARWLPEFARFVTIASAASPQWDWRGGSNGPDGPGRTHTMATLDQSEIDGVRVLRLAGA